MAASDPSIAVSDRVAHTRHTIEQSARRIAVSGTVIDRARARLLPIFTGAAPTPNADVLGQIQRLIETNGTTAAVYGGRIMHARTCDVCRHEILPGSIEYEISFESRRVFMDRRCFALFISQTIAG